MLYYSLNRVKQNIRELADAFNNSGNDSDDLDLGSECGKVTIEQDDESLVTMTTIEDRGKVIAVEGSSEKVEAETEVPKVKKFKVQESLKSKKEKRERDGDRSEKKGHRSKDKGDSRDKKRSKREEKPSLLPEKKAKKDPNLPKGAKGSYMFFAEFFRTGTEL